FYQGDQQNDTPPSARHPGRVVVNPVGTCYHEAGRRFERPFFQHSADRAGGEALAQVAVITLAEGSAVSSVTLDDVAAQLEHYREQLRKTGEQLGWPYEQAAFPYVVEKDGEGRWLYLKGTGKYGRIAIAAGSEPAAGAPEAGGNAEAEGEPAPKARHVVHVVLPDDSTYGDKSKGNELCKYLGKTWKAEVKLFNGRTIYYNVKK